MTWYVPFIVEGLKSETLTNTRRYPHPSHFMVLWDLPSHQSEHEAVPDPTSKADTMIACR